MKLKFHWAEKYEVVREYPSFEVSSEDFPELELEMLQVYNASNITERSKALDALEYKMHQVQPEGGGRGLGCTSPFLHGLLGADWWWEGEVL